jgi:hypothetical protein
MAQQHTYLEEISSPIPAMQLLVNMGWQYLNRGGKEKNVILTGILSLGCASTTRSTPERKIINDLGQDKWVRCA